MSYKSLGKVEQIYDATTTKVKLVPIRQFLHKDENGGEIIFSCLNGNTRLIEDMKVNDFVLVNYLQKVDRTTLRQNNIVTDITVIEKGGAA